MTQATTPKYPANTLPATGTGYAICQSFARAGTSRIVIIQRRQAVLDTAKQDLMRDFPGLKVETHAASQSDFPRMSSIIQSTGEIDILVACATSLQPDNVTKDIPTEGFAESFTVNVVGLHHMVEEFLALPSTKASGSRKTVVHISSGGSQLQTAHGLSAYCASKAAANQVITHFANDEPEGNVKFYSLHPGAVYSPIAQAARPKDAMLWEDEKLPGDMSVWLASQEAEFLNGRYIWSQWDGDELISLEDKIKADLSILTFSLIK